MTGGWADYSWCPAIVLASVIIIFLFDFGAERYVEVKYGIQSEVDIQDAVAGGVTERQSNNINLQVQTPATATAYEKKFAEYTDDEVDISAREQSFRQQIAAFLILEFGVIFHSVIIGLNLGVVGSEFSTLYPVLVFHQSFEGLGIGARMSTIPFKKGSWLPWLLCSGKHGSPQHDAEADGEAQRTA
jgi:zinc transporter 1/2/3